MDDLPKKCDRCGWDRPDTQYVYAYKGSELVETLCKDCDLDERKFNYRKTGRLTTWLVTHATLQNEYIRKGIRRGQTLDAVLADVEEISKHMEGCYNQVWLDGLRKLYLDDSARGMRAKAGGTTMLLYCLAGRVSVQLEQEDGQFIHLLTTDEDSPRPFGVQGVGCSLHAAKAMFGEVFITWQAGRLKPERDDDINIGV